MNPILLTGLAPQITTATHVGIMYFKQNNLAPYVATKLSNKLTQIAKAVQSCKLINNVNIILELLLLCACQFVQGWLDLD